MNMIDTYNSTHLGYLPVRVLQHNIIHTFENANPDFIKHSKSIVGDKKLNPEIGYTINKNNLEGNEIIGPHVKNKERKIYIDETFLAYMWCVCYVLYVESNKLITGDESYSKDTNDLFKYAKSLQGKYSDWDRDTLVNPERYSSENKDNVEKTNAIFQYAIAFILYHEFYHVESGHIDSNIYDNKEISLEMTKEKLENECEADKKAIELMFNGVDESNKKVIKYGITISLCALMFLSGKLVRSTHQDSDNRIRDALDGLDLEDDDTCWLVACASLNIWQNYYGLTFTWEDRGTFKQTFLYASQQCE